MQIEETKFENQIQLAVEGRIDVINAPQLQEKILTSFQKVNTLIIDLEKTVYISSAGLRALLIGKKTADSKGGSMEIINTNESVRKIFQVSGFLAIFGLS